MKAALIVDSLLLFNRQINHLVGSDSNKLFGISGVSLKHSEIYINSSKGVNCSISDLSVDDWPLGKLVLTNILKVNQNIQY